MYLHLSFVHLLLLTVLYDRRKWGNASKFNFILYIVYMYTCTIHLGFVKEIVTKGLRRPFLN